MELVKFTQSSKILKYILIIILGSVALTISAKIKIPFYPVPMTMQTFAIVVIGMMFGWKMGLTIVATYLLQGLAGLPVFAGTPEKGLGFVYMTGPTMGYLIGFLISVFFAGYFRYSKNIFTNFIKILFSISFIYILGLFWLGVLIGWDKPIFELGAKPFLFAEIFKISIAALLALKLTSFKSKI